MAKDKQPFEDLSKTAAQAVEQNMQKASGAMDNYFSFLQSIWGSNIAASTEYIHKLSQAKSFPEVFQIQTEFMQTQMNTFTEQARSLGEAYTKAATGATKPFGMST
jgi:hypothetical protein